MMDMDIDTDRSNIQNRVVEWINAAQQEANDKVKAQTLSKISEVLVHNEPTFIPIYLDFIEVFQVDRRPFTRKALVSFYENLGKKHHPYLPRVLSNLIIILKDSKNDTNLKKVVQSVVQAATTLYKEVIIWLSKTSSNCTEEEFSKTWSKIVELKKQIIELVENEHDSILNQTVRFIQAVIILQTMPTDDDNSADDICVYDIPLVNKILSYEALEAEARAVFDLLVRFHQSKHISSTSLMTCMTVLTAIALSRNSYLGKVIEALETVHTHLPPELSQSQVSAVRKHMKCQLLSLLKQSVCSPYQHNITTLLTDLGATKAEVLKTLPKEDDRKRKFVSKKQTDSNTAPSIPKKMRHEDTPLIIPVTQPPPAPTSSLDLTEAWINERLLPSVAAQIIMETLPNLPDKMPPLFSSAYTPIAAAGTPGQVKHVSRLLATQIRAAGYGPSINELADEKKLDKLVISDDSKGNIITALKPSSILKPILRTPRTLKLAEITKPLDAETRDQFAIDAIRRILDAEMDAANGGALRVRLKIITSMATTFGVKVRQEILKHILDDVRQRLSIGMAWLYEEYSILQGYYKLPKILQHDQEIDHNYNTLLTNLIVAIIDNPDLKDKEVLYTKVYLEAPLITTNALNILKKIGTHDTQVIILLYQMATNRNDKGNDFLNTLLNLTSHHNTEIHKCAIKSVIKFYNSTTSGEKKSIIETFSSFNLGWLKLDKPPSNLFGPAMGITERREKWDDITTECCLRLYLALLPHKVDLISELGDVYTLINNPEVKRIILRSIETPIQKIGMTSAQLMTLLDESPAGAETLISRVLHIVTDKNPASPELVQKVKDLYRSRSSDVRFLIPVLSGLTKDEIYDALPQLIKLNANAVKEVFNRLLGSKDESNSPLTPSELLVALHKIESNQCDLKVVIKATTVCFADKSRFTPEVLAMVIQNLMDVTPLPTLLMRTVIQAISFFPRLIGLAMNVLQRLILKEVWNYRKVWEGFIKCCERTTPNCFQVLLQLPPEQLTDVFNESPALKMALREHISSYSDNQKSHVSTIILDVIYDIQKSSTFAEYDIKNEPISPPELTIDVKEEPQETHEEAPEVLPIDEMMS